MIVDTNVFIDLLKGKEAARKFIETKKRLSTSILVVMEVIAGLPKKSDIPKLERFLITAGITVHPITDVISTKGYDVFTEHFHTMSIGIADALIAATALVNKEEIATLNVKHFHSIRGIRVAKPYS